MQYGTMTRIPRTQVQILKLPPTGYVNKDGVQPLSASVSDLKNGGYERLNDRQPLFEALAQCLACGKCFHAACFNEC